MRPVIVFSMDADYSTSGGYSAVLAKLQEGMT
jgi:hypothetical protein